MTVLTCTIVIGSTKLKETKDKHLQLEKLIASTKLQLLTSHPNIELVRLQKLTTKVVEVIFQKQERVLESQLD